METQRQRDQQRRETSPITLGEHLAEWYEQGEMFLLADPSGREQVQLSREEAYLLLCLLRAHFQQEGEA